jgi:hypothetical protein
MKMICPVLSVLIAMAICSPLAGCAIDRNAKYKVLTVSYDYSGKDRSARAWRAFMDALDRCHSAGYQDAQPVAAPRQQCEAGDANNCKRTHVTEDYDCIGMGYQTSG